MITSRTNFSGVFWLVKRTNLLSKQNISFASNRDWKNTIRQRIASVAQRAFVEWRSALSNTLLALITLTLNGVIFRDMTLKGLALYVCLWEFDREHLKYNASKGWL